MQKKLFSRLVESMRQMDEIARGARAPSREFYVDASQVKEIRALTGLSQPKFARILSAEGDLGLSDLLRGTARLEDVMRQDPLSGLDYIPAGKPGGDMLSLFLSDTMARLLNAMREQYDLILLDTPPIQAMSEARVAASLADAVLLCVRWRDTPRAVLRHALDRLNETHANVVGAVLTRVDPRAHARSGSADSEVYHRRYRRYYRS